MEVTPSEFGHEREGLSLLRETLPDRPPFRAWADAAAGCRQPGTATRHFALLEGRDAGDDPSASASALRRAGQTYAVSTLSRHGMDHALT
ncbi:hypothetical protein GCM10010201_08480 [Pilimelia columellifera subsp. columellifera]|uniref:Uncharacterized protein n=1 Tax=Pilimelia columellifera subsp. columellifera TaxID=706583 RepID=A0ABN3N5F3_9ACTN